MAQYPNRLELRPIHARGECFEITWDAGGVHPKPPYFRLSATVSAASAGPMTGKQVNISS